MEENGASCPLHAGPFIVARWEDDVVNVVVPPEFFMTEPVSRWHRTVIKACSGVITPAQIAAQHFKARGAA